MKKAVYYLGEKALKGVVISEGQNADGPTVTLAKKPGANPFIVGAPVAKTEQPGHAVLGEVEGAEEADDDKTGDKLDP